MTTSRSRWLRRYAVLTLGAGLWVGADNALALALCSVSVTDPLTFGVYQPSAVKTDTGTAEVSCLGIVVGSVGYTVSLGLSGYGSGDHISTRYLNNTTNGGDYMAYNVYTDALYSTVWGDGSTGGLFSGSLSLLITHRSHTFYGKVPPGQFTLLAGAFSEKLIVTVTYNLL